MRRRGGRPAELGPFAAIGPRKQRRLRLVAREWLAGRGEGAPWCPELRFDAIGVELDREGRRFESTTWRGRSEWDASVARRLAVIAVLGAAFAAPASAQAGPRSSTTAAVALGDSFISGEAGRWQGNTVDPTLAAAAPTAPALHDRPAADLRHPAVYLGGWTPTAATAPTSRRS